jgi:dipeptidyl aminopeptidase/acylaminoacyl peptidase
MYIKTITGAGTEEPLVEAEGQRLPADWSADGRYLLFEDREPRGARNVTASILPLFGDRKPIAFFRRGTENGEERFSPDSQWIAFSAEDSGRSEIYLAPVSGAGSRSQVSNAGGDHPRWRRDGKELFYLAPDGKIMAVEVKVAGNGILEAGTPRPLFETKVTAGSGQPALGRSSGSTPPLFDVAPDGRFLIVTPVAGEAPPPITLLVNWAGQKNR